MIDDSHLGEWFDSLVASQDAFDDIHFTGAAASKQYVTDKKSLVLESCRLLSLVHERIAAGADGCAGWRAFVNLPLPYSDNVLTWNSSLWNQIASDTSPSLYIVKNGKIFSEWWEEYRRPVSMPWSSGENWSAIFRSFRTKEYLAMYDDVSQGGLEFANSIYILRKLL